MNSSRSSNLSNNKNTPRKITHNRNKSKINVIQNTKNMLHKRLANKYCTCQNYMTLSQINRTILGKQCVLKTTTNDIKFDSYQQKIQSYFPLSKSTQQLAQLIQYYKYYSQKSVLFIKQFFPLLYQYQQKRKVIQYNRLKVLLNLSDSAQPQNSPKKNKHQQSNSSLINKSRIGISRNMIFGQDQSKKIKGYQGINILDQLNFSGISTQNQLEQSLLINRLRNNLSKHIGPSKVKNLSIQQLDKFFQFQKKDQMFNASKQNLNMLIFNNGKQKQNFIKPKKFVRQQTHTNTPQDAKNKNNIRRRSAKRNNSCQIMQRVTTPKSPYQTNTTKLRRKKNLSMDNLYTHKSTPYVPEQKRQNSKVRKINPKTGQKQRYLKQKQNTLVIKGPQILMESISDLKSRIKKQKQKLLKSVSGVNYLSLKRQKPQYTSINTANQRFAKKNYQKLRQKTLNGQ